MAKSKVFKGVIWASLQRFGTLAISFVSNMVLARLLTPDDFGTIGMLLFFIAIAQTFVDSGFGAALIQKKNVTDADINTVFYINMGMSVVGYAILFISAPYIASFYDVPILCNLLRVQSLAILISGVTLVQSVQLTKRMDFKNLSICNLVGAIALALSGIIAAFLGCGVWSLVIRTLVGSAVTSFMLWHASNWFPQIKFSKQSFKELFSFGGFMLLSSVLTTITNNIQTLIIGKMFSPKSLGNYTQARNLRNIASDGITSVIGQVLYPDFANIQDDNKLIQEHLNKSAYIITYIVAPIMIYASIFGANLIHLFFGQQWDEAILYFQLMCIGGIPICLQDININVIKAKGHSKCLFYINIIKVAIYFFLMLIGAKLAGMLGLIISMIIYVYVAYIVFALLGTFYIKASISIQLIYIFKSLSLSLPSAAICLVLQKNCSNWSDMLICIVALFLYIIVLLIVSQFTKPYPYVYIKKNIFHIKK